MILIAHIGSLLTLVTPRQSGADRDTLHRFRPVRPHPESKVGAAPMARIADRCADSALTTIASSTTADAPFPALLEQPAGPSRVTGQRLLPLTMERRSPARHRSLRRSHCQPPALE